MTRPEPTIYGNCESWNFIVGKKPSLNSPKICKSLSFMTGNKRLWYKIFYNFIGLILNHPHSGSVHLNA
jgi:hypothetical protein